MSTHLMEQGIAEMKKRIERLEAGAGKRPSQRWRETVSSIKPNDLTREAAKIGAEWRAEENKCN